MIPQGWFDTNIRLHNLSCSETTSSASKKVPFEPAMKQLHIFAVIVLVLVFSLPGHADEASAAYKHGVHAESHNQYEQAYEAYSKAHSLKPQDPKYFTAYARMRFYVAAEDVRSGQQLLDAGKLQEALKKFQRAAEIDETNFFAQAQDRQIADLLRKQAQREQLSAVMQSPMELAPPGASTK